jgi:hypothetical protein
VEVAVDGAVDAEFSDFMAGRWSQLVRLGYGLTGDAPDVRRVTLRLSDGTSQSYRAVAMPGGGGRVFGYEFPPRVRITAARAYGSRGQLVGSMTGAQTHEC